MDPIKVIFSGILNTGMKVNTKRYSFGVNKITSLRYMITWDVIKLDKKVQGIINIGIFTSTNGVQEILGMSQ